MKYLLLFLLILSSHVFAENIITQYDMNMEAYKESLSEKKKLDNLYRHLLIKYRKNPVFVRNLIDSQKKWETYMKSQMELVYKSSNDKQRSVYPTCVGYGRAAIFLNRFNELKQLEDEEEGNVCKFEY